MKALYTATFETDESGKYYARIPDLPRCITTGRDLEDAIDMITDAANL
ncbi:MAG: type II toxin-antitoxin system HicB family antitoxin [Lachnospiraceae bacterium]|nr:type II toxin-antitoxin system HicB family antitoxin [Lachnospiraceae bacterium]